MTLAEQMIDIQHNAYVLADLAKCLDLIIEEGADFDGLRGALSGVVFDRARSLSDQLERLEVRA